MDGIRTFTSITNLDIAFRSCDVNTASSRGHRLADINRAFFSNLHLDVSISLDTVTDDDVAFICTSIDTALDINSCLK